MRKRRKRKGRKRKKERNTRKHKYIYSMVRRTAGPACNELYYRKKF